MSVSPLQAVVIIESDVNRDVMAVWSYPSMTPVDIEGVLVAQAEPFISHSAVAAAKASGRKPSSQYFTRYGGVWTYGYGDVTSMFPLQHHTSIGFVFEVAVVLMVTPAVVAREEGVPDDVSKSTTHHP